MRNQHAVCVPFQAQSHIGGMLKVAKILHHRGFFITFVNTEFNHRRLLRSGGLTSLEDIPGWRFASIPDGLPLTDADATQDIPAMCDSSRNFMSGPFTDLIAGLNKDTLESPRVSHIVSDGFSNFVTSPAAEKFGIPLIHLFTISACSLLALKHHRQFLEKCIKPMNGMRESNKIGYYGSEGTIDWIPGMKNMRPCDMPYFFGATNEEDDTFLHFVMDIMDQTGKADATMLLTFEKLESDALRALSRMIPNICGIGPLHVLLERIPQDESVSKHIHGNLWKEHVECLEWLDKKEPESVLYVNFGSVAFLTHEQLIELAMGVANSKHPFLWVLRSDLVNGETAILPSEFIEETKDRGFLSGWCPQEKVLNHPSVGGFLTHNGWNSTFESLSLGVPMICWPSLMDQQTNARYVCAEWKVGLEAGWENARRDKIEGVVRELLGSEKGRELKKRAMEWKRLAEEAVSPGGSSVKSLDEVFGRVRT
ncbi:hypothetical protein MLD38_037126 [Melastoma candidum]|uniref:Uncharacterized protein n=1 Tax=Melastoma candidum TaxID=119954 RepID=A0ACB9LLQ4_9MYRT|nr:hypothetical protein MLD38_037126 [Melastoma candidum]